jgi:hypothetical protein
VMSRDIVRRCFGHPFMSRLVLWLVVAGWVEGEVS